MMQNPDFIFWRDHHKHYYLDTFPSLYQALQNLAKQTGKTPEEMATGRLEKDLEIIDDPVDEFIGTFQSNISD